MHNIHLFYNKTIVDLCFARHGIMLLNSKLIILTSAPRRSIWRLLFNNTPCTLSLFASPVWSQLLSGCFSAKNSKTFEGMTGVTAIVDDILVFG